MSNTSNNKTANSKPTKSKDKDKLRVIVGEIGRDSKTGILGRGYSSDNGKTFHVTDTMYGRLYDPNDIEGIWNGGTADKVKKEVDSAAAEIPAAVSAANSAVSAAESAVAASKVNSDAIVAQSEAISEAKSAMDSATAEIQQTAANAASDAAKIRADVAQVQNEVDTAKAANSASVEALKSDIGAAKQDLADVHDSLDKAQSAIKQNQKLINDNVAKITSDVSATKQDLADVHDSLTKAQAAAEQNQKAIDESIAQINADITQNRKNIANAQQVNADTAKQLDTYSKQAQEQGKTIKSIQDKQDGFTATIADVQGNVTQVSDKVDGLSASLKDTQGNVASVKAQADQLSATLTDHAKSIATLTASAKELSSTLEDADGRLSKVEQTAQTNSSTLSDVQGDLSQVKQDATTLTATLKDAQGNISTLQQKADSVSAQLASAQGDIASLKTDVTGIKATLVSHEGDIHTLQADSKALRDDMTDAQGNISSLQKSSTKLDSEMSSQDGRLSKVEQTAKEHTSTISDLGKKVDSNGGGVNLLTNTQLFDYNWTWDQIGHSFTNGVLTLSDTNNGNSRMYQGVAGGNTTGRTFSLSFNSRISADCNSKSVQVKAGPYDVPKFVNITSQDFQPYKVENWQWTGQSGTFSFYVAGGKIDITNLKLEYGAVATPYSLAPADLATISQVKQTADGIEATLKNAQGDIDQIKQTAKGTSEQLSNVQGNVTNIQKDVDGLKQTTADNAGNIHTLQSDSKTLKDDMQDVQGNISTLQKTSTDVTSELQDHAGRISKVEQTASTLTNEFSDQDGRLSKVEQTATGTQQTVANQQGQINSIQTDVSGIHETITGQGNQIATINTSLNGLNTKYEGVSGDLGKLKSQAQWVTVTSAVDLNNVKTPCHEFLKGTVTNAPNEAAWWYLKVEGLESGRITQTVIADQSNNRYTRRWADSWSAWVKDATQNDVNALSNRITTNSTQITQNQQAIALKADQATVNSLSGEVSQAQAQLKAQAGQISSKVSSTDFKTLDDKVNGMKIGGRNLVAGTGQDTVIDDTANTGTQGWGFWVFNLTQQPKVGDQITVSSESTLTGKGNLGTYEVILYNSTTTANRSNSRRLTAGKRSSATLEVTNLNGTGDTVLLIYAGNIGDTEGKKNVIHHLKVEFGNVATDWTPAPEDLTTAIQKNSTAIDQTNQEISLKADQTEVDQIKNTASQNSSRLDVMAGQISSKVTSTDVNNIVDGKGYATTSTVQSLITQKAGTINESITNLTNEVNTRNGVNLLKGTKDFSGSWHNDGSTNYWHTENWIDPNGNHSVKSDLLSWCGYYQPIYLDTGDYTFSGYYYSEGGKPVYCYLRPNVGDNLVEVSYNSNLDSTPNGWRWFVVHFKVTKAGNAAVRLESGQNQVLHIASYKLERGTVTKPVWTPAPSDNATVTQVQQITASIDGLQSTVTNKADKSQITQLSNLVQSKVNSSDFNSKVTQLSTDINARVTKGDLLSQINLEAGRALIQSNKIFLDADTVVFSGKAFIPSAAITSLDADKIASGYIKVPMSDGNGNTVQVSNNGVDIVSNNQNTKLFSANRGTASVHIDAAGMNFGATTNGTYELLGGLSPLLDDTDGDFGGMSNHNGIGFVVETQQQYGSPYGGDFFSLARSIKGPPSYYNGFLYEATGSGKHEIGSHFFDPIYVHPWGADNYMHATWVSWTAWDNNEKYPAIVQAGSNMGGICFPKSGEVTLFTASGKSFTPSQWKGSYTGYQHGGAGNAYHDPSQGA